MSVCFIKCSVLSEKIPYESFSAPFAPLRPLRCQHGTHYNLKTVGQVTPLPDSKRAIDFQITKLFGLFLNCTSACHVASQRDLQGCFNMLSAEC